MTRGETVRSGRLPDFTGTAHVLPRAGRTTPPPAWPLPGTPTPREAQLWAKAWARPQALIWERDGLEDLVALYVRKSAEAEAPGSSAATVASALRLADDLLLTVPAMRRAGVSIAEDPANAAPRPASRSGSFRPGSAPASGSVVPINGGTPGHKSSRERFRRVPSSTPNLTEENNPA